MKESDFEDIVERSLTLRRKYHELELQHHGSEWTVEEDALAFLTDAALVGRNIMAQQGRWPSEKVGQELRHKIGESICWLIILANRSNINLKGAIEDFLARTEKKVE